MPRHKQPVKKPLELQWREHDNQRKRVWNVNWFGDQFEVISIEDFDKLEAVCKTYNIPLNEAEND